MPTHRDPRIGPDFDYSFVEPVPLPIPSQKGLKIQARSAVVYNPALPSRDDVRRENYSRRLQQSQQQGFSSVNFKPYKGIGDPFYLDQKKLILHALGQWQEGQELSSSSRPKSDDEQQKLLEQQKNMQPKAATKFRLRRARKDLHTLNKGVLHAKEIIRNVSLGHGLFYLLNKEKMVKMNTHQQEMRRRREKQLSEWQPPKSHSSSESESEDEGTADIDLTSGTPSTQQTSSWSRGGRSQSSHSRKHPPEVRPYTPHTTISVEPQDTLDKESLFRQLCALYWLLEAMSMDVGNMPPITTSWNLKHFASNKVVDARDREKLENKWTDFIRLKAYREANLQSSRESNFKRSSSFLRASPSTLLSTPSSSQSQLFHGLVQILHPMSTAIPEHSEVGAVTEAIPAVSETETSDTGYYGCSDRENTDVGQSCVQDEEKTGRRSSSSRLSIAHLPMGQKPGTKLLPEALRTNRKSVDIRKATETLRAWSDEDSWIERRMEDGEHKGSRNSLRAERNIRPKSSPAVMKFQMECTSNDAHDMAMRMRQEFVEISEEQAIIMHNTLEAIERERMRKMQNKFVHMPTRYSNFYKAVKVMRSKSAQDDTKKMKNRRRSSIHKQWYVDLDNNIGAEASKDWYVTTILNKLKKRYGMVGPVSPPVITTGPVSPPVITTGPVSPPVITTGPVSPPVITTGPVSPPVITTGPVSPPVITTGPVSPPVITTGPVSPPVITTGPVSPPVITTGPVSPPIITTGPVSPPVITTGPVSPPVITTGPVSPPVITTGPVSPPVITTGPVSPPVITTGPVSPPVITTGPVSPPVITTGPVSPPVITTGPVSPPVITTGPVSPPVFTTGPVSPPVFTTGPVSPPVFTTGPVSPPVITTGPVSPPVITTGPVSPPVITTGPVSPPVITTGPVSPPVITTGPVSPPVITTGPVSPPVIPTGPVSPPVIATGHVSPPVIATGPVSPPVIATGPVSPPVIATGPVSPPVTATGPVSPPVTTTGPVSPPVITTGPVSPPVITTGPVSPPVITTGHVSPPIITTGPVSPPVTTTGPVSPPVIATGPVSPSVITTGPVSPSVITTGPVSPLVCSSCRP
ncbi:hypothetical protein LSAT2_007661 [Lamellibrachia satsuma]|nr:hypothetical protein LSAT2_007661 [Lamellibrachia satsuma]